MNTDKDISLSAELVRKSIHLFALVIPIGYYFIRFPVAISLLSAAAVVSIFIDIARFRNWRIWSFLSRLLLPIIRDHEIKGGFTGASYILTTSAITIVLFPKLIAITAIVFIIVGDTAAALVGRTCGRHKFVGNKSIEGSLACLISLVLVTFIIPGLATPVGLVGALAATLAEAFTFKIDDNMTVPIASGFAMLVTMSLLGYEGAKLFTVLW